jgi:hypothetical protein
MFLFLCSSTVPAASGHLSEFSFMSITSNAVGRMVFLLNFLNYCFHLFVVMCCMFSIMQSPFLFFLLCGRCTHYTTLHRLRLLKLLTSKRVRLKLCKALLLPYHFYCNVVFSHLFSSDIRRLQVAFNSCTRYVFNLRRYDH